MSGIPGLDLNQWREKPADLLPTQFNSEALYPKLKESIVDDDKDDDGHVDEAPRPSFLQAHEVAAGSAANGSRLQFVGDEADLQDILSKPAIGNSTKFVCKQFLVYYLQCTYIPCPVL